jgi:cellulose synthase/poly-beta-1,6-N-acetylglucosamine synthase-like glycosyltransferase
VDQTVTSEAWHICILVPARDEQDLIARCITSVQRARACVELRASTDIVIAVDRSIDRTHEIARRITRSYGAVVTTEAGNVGAARALAATVALRRWTGRRDCCWFANTDADTEVPKSWLADQLALAETGVQAIAGTVNVDTFAEHNPIVRELFRKTYTIAGDGSHPHVHGANFGLRADAYLNAGGWPNLATAEDHALWHRLGEIGASRISVDHIRVSTSGRRNGRAPHGFAETLAAHNGPLR